jgi:hypothetical protein
MRPAKSFFDLPLTELLPDRMFFGGDSFDLSTCFQDACDARLRPILLIHKEKEHLAAAAVAAALAALVPTGTAAVALRTRSQISVS